MDIRAVFMLMLLAGLSGLAGCLQGPATFSVFAYNETRSPLTLTARILNHDGVPVFNETLALSRADRTGANQMLGEKISLPSGGPYRFEATDGNHSHARAEDNINSLSSWNIHVRSDEIYFWMGAKD